MPAKRLRRLEMANAFHGMSFMNMPAMLHRAAQVSICSIALFSFFIQYSN